MAVPLGGQTVQVSGVVDRLGAITGTVVDPDGAPVAGVRVEIEQLDGPSYGYPQTDGSGSYSAHRLAARSYRVRFSPPWDSLWLAQWYSGKEIEDQADAVVVELNRVAGGVDARLARGGTVTGRVTNASGEPLAGISVTVSGPDASGTSTDSNGEYASAGLLGGDYTVRFEDPMAGYLPLWYSGAVSPDTANPSQATPIVLQTGEDRAGLDLSLAPGFCLSGRVLDPGRRGVYKALVKVYDPFRQALASTETLPGGECTLCGLAPGDHRVFVATGESNRLSGQNLAGGWCLDRDSFETADPYVVTDHSLADLEFLLGYGGAVAGRVTDAQGRGVSGVDVLVYRGNELNGFGMSGADGAVQPVTGLKAGEYTVAVVFPYADIFYGSWFDGKAYRELADPVTVRTGQTTLLTLELPVPGDLPAPSLFLPASAGPSYEVRWSDRGAMGCYEVQESLSPAFQDARERVAPGPGGPGRERPGGCR